MIIINFTKYTTNLNSVIFAGLLITYVALNLMDGHGQPALLYIVPFTLGTSMTKKSNHMILSFIIIKNRAMLPSAHHLVITKQSCTDAL